MAQTGDHFGSDAFQRFLRQSVARRYRLHDFLSRLAELPEYPRARAVSWVGLSLRAMGGIPADDLRVSAAETLGDMNSPIDVLGSSCQRMLADSRLDEGFLVRNILTTTSQWIYLYAEMTPRWAEHKQHLLSTWEEDLARITTDPDYVPRDPTSRNLGLSREAWTAYLEKMITFERQAHAGVDDTVGDAVADAELWDRLVLLPLMASPSS